MNKATFGWAALGLLGTFASSFASGTASAQDKCEVFEAPAFTGAVRTLTLPAVTSTRATGVPLNSFWANTSTRFSSLDLGSSNNKTTSARVRAVDSDVALYLFDGGDFNGKGTVIHCQKGRTCTLELGSAMNDKTSSAICQREFFRKSKSITNTDPTFNYFQFLANPIIDYKVIIDAVDKVVQQEVSSHPDVDAYRPRNSDDGYSLWSRATWMTAFDYCKRFNTNCTADEQSKVHDMFRISKRFEIDVDNGWVDSPFGITVDDDYVVQADWFVRPVIDDVDANASTPNELRFWWARTSWWVEEGTLHNRVYDGFVPKIRAIDIQSALRLVMALAMGEAGCSACIDGKSRLQFSYFTPANIGKTVWLEDFELDVTTPKMVLNSDRTAVYP